MTIDPIHLGSAPNDGTGQNLRSGGQTINDNFAELDSRTATAQATAEQGTAQAVAAKATAERGIAQAVAAKATAEQGVAQAFAAKAKADAAIPASALGATVAQLVSGTVPASQLPSFVDEVLEFATLAVFPAVGEAGKIYIASDTNSLYRWTDGGSQYLLLSAVKGINSDITELAGLTTALSVSQGGTGGRDQAGARAGLGLGTAATANITTSVTDGTAGRALKVGDFGVGSTAIPYIADLNSFTASGKFRYNPDSANGPEAKHGTVEIAMYDWMYSWTQTAVALYEGGVFTRSCINGAIQPWQRLNTETITNANGTATKFPDGTMICRSIRKEAGPTNIAVNAGLFINSGIPFQWPVAFVGDLPVVNASSESYSVSFSWSSLNIAPSLTGVQDVRTVSTANGALAKLCVTAVGRWK